LTSILNKFATLPIVPDHLALAEIARQIWTFIQEKGERPLILLTTAGPAMPLRKLMEKYRPVDLPPHLVFLPEIQGLNQWLEQTPDLLSLPKYSMVERWGEVYSALEDWKEIRQQLGALGEGGKWTLAQAIVAACDKLSESKLLDVFHTALESTDILGFGLLEASADVQRRIEEVFQEVLDQAYPDLSQQMISLDGRLILAFWKNLSTTSDPVIRQRLAFNARLKTADQPLVWIESAQVFGVESVVHQSFLNRYAEQFSVLKIEMNWNGAALWPEALPHDEGTPLDFSEKHFDPQAQKLVLEHRQKYHSAHWRLIAGKRFEDIAWAGVASIEEHFSQGRHNIALIAQDRLVARRMRALLSRLGEGVSVRDSTGWKLSTTQAAAAIHSWIELIRQPNGPSLINLLGFLKNPLIDYKVLFKHLLEESELTPETSLADDWLWELEQLLIREEVGTGWQALMNCFEKPLFDGTSLQQSYGLQFRLLNYLRQKSQQWHRGARLSLDWSTLLIQDLKTLGMLESLKSDEAGQQLLESLNHLDELKATSLSVNAWLSLFELWLEQTSYIETPQTGQLIVSIFPLSGIRLRTFDAVVMVGCDDRQLPSFSDPGLFFSNAFVRSLGMKGMEEEYVQQSRDLSQLLISHQFVDLFWQEFAEADAQNRPASWLVRLMRDSQDPLVSPISLPYKNAKTRPVFQSKVGWDSKMYPLPGLISPSAYKTLRDCPYRFYVSKLLGLRQPKVLEHDSDFSLIGQLLHRILKIFHQKLKTQDAKKGDGDQLWSDQDRKIWMEKNLSSISQSIFEPYVLSDGRFMAANLAWKKQIPSWIDWQLHREKEGWHFHNGECKVGFDLRLSENEVIRIEGYPDRLDLHEEHGFSVIDYKFQNVQVIKSKAVHIDDDPQLLIYAKAVDHDPIVEEQSIREMSWVGLKVKHVDKLSKKDASIERDFPLENYEEKIQGLIPNLARDLGAVWSGKEMYAYAPDSVCQYCDARGICRKGMWS
jgi:ATP-dependent helicase/nuclease subunit B